MNFAPWATATSSCMCSKTQLPVPTVNLKKCAVRVWQNLISVSETDSLNPDPGILLNPDPDPGKSSDENVKKFTICIFLLIKTVLNVFEIPGKGRKDKLLSSPAPELFSYERSSLYFFLGTNFGLSWSGSERLHLRCFKSKQIPLNSQLRDNVSEVQNISSAWRIYKLLFRALHELPEQKECKK